MIRRLAARLYLLTLRAFPPAHRTEYSAEMADTFEREFDSRRGARGRWRAAQFVFAACLDAVAAGIGERRRRRRADGLRTGSPVVAWVGRDMLHAVRSLAKARTFTPVSVISLGIGMGTVFAFLGLLRVLIGPPPGITGERLVELVVLPQDALRAQVGDWAIDTWSYPDFTDVRDNDTGMTIVGWAAGDSLLRLPDGGGGLRVDAMYVSPGYFTAIDVPLARGRGFDPGESAGQPKVVVGYRFWQNRLAADPQIVGRTLVVNGVPHVVVGVAAEGFRGHLSLHRPGFQLWLPLSQHPRLAGPRHLRFDRDADWVRILGRLSPGTSLTEANAVITSIMSGIAERHPASNRLKSASVEPYFPTGARRRFDAVAEAITLVIGAGIVLLVVCLNLSGMVLIRSATRERELAVRLAIGASRGRLIQYLLSEAVVLAIAAGALAASIAFGTPAALSWWFNMPLDEAPKADAAIAAICAVVCFATSLVFGLLPAIRFSRPAVMWALKDEAGGGGRRVGRVHRLTVAIQAGIAVPFLVIGGVQLDQVRRTARAELGFQSAGLFAAPLDVSAPGGTDDDPGVLVRSVQGQLERVAGVTSVAAANGLPLDQESRIARVVRDGVPTPVRAHTTRISPGYFETMGIRLLRGRGITPEDQAGSEPAVVVTESLASRLFPEGAPLGQRLTFALDGSHAPVDFRWSHVSAPSAPQTFTVVGVTADVVDGYMGPPGPQLFVALAQHPAPRVFVIARSSLASQVMTSAYETAVAGVYPEPDVIRSSIVTGEDLVRRGRGELAFGSTLSGAAAAVTLMLTALGIFGVIGFMVATRTREIGIRIALGASRSRVLGNVLVDAVKVAAPGVVFGLLVAFLAAQEVAWAAQDGVAPFVYAAAVGTALGVALVAGVPAARRAAAVEPIVAMRVD